MILFSKNCCGLPNGKLFELLEMKLIEAKEPGIVYVLDVFHEANFKMNAGAQWWCAALVIHPDFVGRENACWKRTKKYASEIRAAGKRVALVGTPERSLSEEDRKLFDRFVY